MQLTNYKVCFSYKKKPPFSLNKDFISYTKYYSTYHEPKNIIIRIYMYIVLSLKYNVNNQKSVNYHKVYLTKFTSVQLNR